MKKEIILIICGLIVMMSCATNKKNIVGKYSFQRKNIIDTLVIKDNGYVHKIFNKNFQLMYEENNEWTLEGDRLTLLKFYNNEDNQLEEPLTNEDVEKFLMITSFPIYKQGNEIVIEVNADENVFYKKIHNFRTSF